MNRTTFLLAAALLAAFTLPPELLAQSANVRPRNINQNTRGKSGIFKGSGNLIQSNATASFIGGGQSNTVTINSTNAVIGGGFANAAQANFGAVGGGLQNTNAGFGSVIGGGEANEITSGSSYSTIGGGLNNEASGNVATVPGGTLCFATHDGSFVWSGEPFATTSSWGDYTFTVRALGGARFYTASGTGVGVELASGSGTWTSLSDRNAKENFDDVNASEVLAKVAAIPIKTWNYKTQADSIRHIGPMAQDFKSAFGVGESETGITTVDADGVALAAIKGLVEELKERDKQIEELKMKSAEVETLKMQNAEVQTELRAIREQLSKLPPQ